jgi:alkanesulfonate monooxygenase SsuD/methylene tetrahydromethanopterin reductase-like flavin-dependent oxidoreductase (luciferase family)
MYDAQAINWGMAARQTADALLARGLWIDDDGDTARQHALAWLAAFRRSKQSQWKVGFRGPLAEMDERESLACMIVGSPQECAAQLHALLTQRTVPRLAFNPMHEQAAIQIDQMRRLLQQVVPQLVPHALPRRDASSHGLASRA